MDRPDRQQRIARYRDRLAADPGAKVFAPLADLLRAAGRIEEALVILEEGLTRHPGYLSGRVVLGRTLLEAGDPARGREVLLGVLETDPENLVVLKLLVEEATGRNAWREARPHLEMLAALDPDRWAETLADFPREKRDSRDEDAAAGPGTPARSGLPSEAELTGDPSFATMTLVDIYLAQGYRDKARLALERILAREPDNAEVAERLAQLGEDAGERISPVDGDGSVSDLPPAEQRARKTARRTEDKQKFKEWITRLRDDERPAP